MNIVVTNSQFTKMEQIVDAFYPMWIFNIIFYCQWFVGFQFTRINFRRKKVRANLKSKLYSFIESLAIQQDLIQNYFTSE